MKIWIVKKSCKFATELNGFLVSEKSIVMNENELHSWFNLRMNRKTNKNGCGYFKNNHHNGGYTLVMGKQKRQDNFSTENEFGKKLI